VVAALFYNKALFKRLGLPKPETYDELKRVIARFRAEGIIPLAFGNDEPWIGGMLAGLIIQRIGGTHLLSEVNDGTVPWNHPDFIKAGRVIQELGALGAFPEKPNTIGYTTMVDMFSNGKAAMMVMGSWFIQNLIDADSMPEETFGVMPFPTFPGGKGEPAMWMGQTDMNLVISSRCRDKALALSFVRQFSQPDCQSDLVLKTGSIPVGKIAIERMDIQPVLASLIMQLETMKGMFLFPDIHLGPEVGPAYNHAIHSVVAGREPNLVFSTLEADVHSR
jgi:raffinose/stachyose/melibiose transport system substrate-binding protein